MGQSRRDEREQLAKNVDEALRSFWRGSTLELKNLLGERDNNCSAVDLLREACDYGSKRSGGPGDDIPENVLRSGNRSGS